MGPGSSAREKVSEPIHPQTYLIGNISAEKYQNPFMCVKVIANQMWDVF